MNDYRFVTRKIIKLTEAQFREMFLNETMHHPHYLDALIEDISQTIISIAQELVSFGQSYLTQTYNKDNDFFTNLFLNIAVYPCFEGTSDVTNYKANFISGILIDNKIDGAILNVWLPFDSNGKVNEYIIKSFLAHEVMHLFDDYTNQINGLPPVSNDTRTDRSYAALHDINITQNKLAKQIGMFVYLSSSLEMKAYLAQTMDELQRLNCNPMNYREVMRQTIPYRNYNRSYQELCQSLDTVNDEELQSVLQILNQNLPNSNLPKPSANNLKVKLQKWVDGVYHEFIKKYGGVVVYYLDNHSPQFHDIVL